jgi:hypothetical protein
MMSLPLYEYEPLDQERHEIRLVNLYPATEFSAPVQCSILKTTLKTPLTFYALSYCWGDKTHSPTIKLEGTSLSVTVNLHFALRRIRQIIRETPLFLWIDAISINQKDDGEKSSQIPLMRSIFETATATIIWLGEGLDDSAKAFRFLKAWADYDTDEIDGDFSKFIKKYPFALEKDMWKAAELFFGKSWWTRIWTYQEYTVANDQTYLWGTDLMSDRTLRNTVRGWNRFKHSEAWKAQSGEQSRNMGLVGLDRYYARTWARNIRRLRQINEPAQRGLPVMDLPRLLTLTRSLHASDPRDRLYGLLGIDEGKDIAIHPDYRAPVSTVYTDFAVSWMETRNNLDLLCETGIGYVSLEDQVEPPENINYEAQISVMIPSWVPDLRRGAFKGQNLTDSRRCDGGYNATYVVDSTRTLLTVRGVICDKLSNYVSPMLKDIIKQHVASWELTKSVVCAHPTGINQTHAFFRTLTADDGGSDLSFDLVVGFMIFWGKISLDNDPLLQKKFQNWANSVKGKGGTDYAQYFMIFQDLIPEIGETRSDKELLRPFFASSREDYDLTPFDRYPKDAAAGPLYSDYMLYAISATAKKSFFTTSKGYLGLGPQLVAKDDLICVIFGCPHPLLLRKVNDHYRVVGEVHVYGMMQGEMIAKLEAGELEEKEFVLH